MPHYRLHRDPRSSHQQIANRLRQLGKKTVLDVGAAQGMMGELLIGSGITIDAVEPNPQWAQACKPNYRNVMVGTIESVKMPDEKYGAIVCGDVLEHTADPAGILMKLLEMAAEDAVFLISLPNVAHLAVRLMLLFGRLPKMEYGILDKTHLQFYTRDTAEQMLHRAGLRIVRVNGTSVPLATLWKNGAKNPLFPLMMQTQYRMVDLLPRLFAMQFIFEAVRSSKSSGKTSNAGSSGSA